MRLSGISRTAVILMSPLLVAAAGSAISPEHVQLVAAVSSGVAMVAGLVAWIDRRIDDKLSVHFETDSQWRELILDELKELRALINRSP